MKKFLWVIILLALTTTAYAAPKWVPTAYSGDQIVKTGQATIVDVNIYWKGLTVGDKIQLKNGVATTATPVLTYIVPTANGTAYYPKRSRDLLVDTGIYLDETISGGVIGIELIYQ